MRADRSLRPLLALAVLLVAVLVVSTACGGDGDAEDTPATVEQVVRDFSEALNEGDNERAAALLADGAVLYGETVPPGGGEEAVAKLACTAEIESIESNGDRVTAQLRFTGQRESAVEECGPAGGSPAPTVYTVQDGKITQIAG